MKVLILSLFVFMITLVSCNTDYNYIDSGLSNGVHDCTMYDYFKTNSYNWDTTRLMIDLREKGDMIKSCFSDRPIIRFVNGCMTMSTSV